MPRKADLITELYRRTVKDITKSERNWMSFLNTAAWQYKYPFSDQVCIYAQKPNAIACAEIELWNTHFDRWVNQGAHGIALIRDRGGRAVLTHVFDVSDTHSKKEFDLWTLEDGQEKAISEALENRFGELKPNRTFAESVESAVHNLCEDSFTDYLDNLMAVKGDSLLEDYDEDNLRARFLPILKNSVLYAVLTRIGYLAKEYVDWDVLHGIYEFDTPDTANCLGSATADLTEVCLREIERTVKAEKLKNRTFDEKEQSGYNLSGKQNTPEKGEQNNGKDTTERSSDSAGFESSRDSGETPRQVRNDAPSVSDEASQRDLYDLFDRKQTDRAFVGDRAESQGNGIGDYKLDGTEPWPVGNDESREPDAVGADDEQSQSVSRGDRETPVDRVITEYPVNEPTQTEPAFSMPENRFGITEETLDTFLRLGGCTKYSSYRIYAFFSRSDSVEDKIEFLKAEYETDAVGFLAGGQKCSATWDENGVVLAQGDYTEKAWHKVHLSWEDIRKRVDELIRLGQYLSDGGIPMALDRFDKEAAEKITYLLRDLRREDEPLEIDDAVKAGTAFDDEAKHYLEVIHDPNRNQHFAEQLTEVVNTLKVNLKKARAYTPQYTAMLTRTMCREPVVYPASENLPSTEHYFSQDQIDNQLIRRGSSMSEGKFRIFSFFLTHKDTNERAKFLANEYGIGGHGGARDNDNHDGKGLAMSGGLDSMSQKLFLMTWPQVAKRVDDLIRSGRYMTGKELSRLDRYEREQVATAINSFYMDRDPSVVVPFEKTNYYFGGNIEEIAKQLESPERVREILSMMKEVAESEMPGSRHYDRNQKEIETVEKFADGKLDLFPGARKKQRLPEEKRAEPISEEPKEEAPLPSFGYDLHLGTEVYIGQTQMQILSMSEEKVELFDGTLIPYELSFADFRKRVSENPLNDDLKTAMPVIQKAEEPTEAKKDDLWQTYAQAKNDYPDHVVSMRVGDFYEFFGDDAQKVADTLGLTLTTRGFADGIRRPMCGFPFHKEEEYFRKLTDADFKVAIVENGQARSKGREQSELEKAKAYIQEFCRKEYDTDADFSDLNEVGLAYSTVTDSERPLQVNVDLVNCDLSAWVDNVRVVSIHFNSLSDLNEHWLSSMAFDDLYGLANDYVNEAFLERAERESNAVSELLDDCKVDDMKLTFEEETFVMRDSENEWHGREIYDFLVNELVTLDENKQVTEGYDIPAEHVQAVVKLAEEYGVDFHLVKNEMPSMKAQKPVEKVRPTAFHLEIPMDEKTDYHAENDNQSLYFSPNEKYQANVEAIRLLKKLEAENRLATLEEQKVLAGYVGWGGLADCFDEKNQHYTELKSLLTEEEYNAARESTLTAFYTPSAVMDAIYQALGNMGFERGNILEPSCGVGNFIGSLPKKMRQSRVYGVELDSISGRIARQLYQRQNITVNGFEKTAFPDSFFDVAVGNVPFGQFKVLDPKYDKYNFLIHDYFFAKTLDKVRPGGIVAMITSKGTMDKENPAVRKYIAERADLIGAIRLPNNTFKANAGTEAVADILFLQKRDHRTTFEPDWVHLDKDENGIPMNSYFVSNPDMILGQMKMHSGPFGPEPTCVPYDGENLSEQLSEAISNIHAEIREAEEQELEEDNSIPADPTVKNFSYTLVDGKLYYRQNSVMNPVDTSLTGENRIKGMIHLRDITRELIDAQLHGEDDEKIATLQTELNRAYDRFSEKYGLINSRANEMVFSDDNSYYLLCSLEVLDEVLDDEDKTKLKRKADMFTKRTIKPQVSIDHVDTASEALAVSLSERAFADMLFMTELTGKSESEILTDLRGVLFRNPMYGKGNDREKEFVPADEYLSGNVREKLATARKIAETNPDYAVNVEALEAVQPKDLEAGEISVKLGSTWVPDSDVQDFMFELLGTPSWLRWRMQVKYVAATAQWCISDKSYDRGNVKANNTFGTSRINAYEIIEDTLNLKDVRIFDYIEDENGNKKPVLNKKETTIAQGKQEEIKRAFEEWIWQKPERRERLCRIYNEKFNSIRPREFDGSHIHFYGMNPEITLRPHQKNAVARILYGGNALLGHVVGAGKTFTMVAAAQEAKRLGLSNKSMIVVPNHLIEQWASEYLQLYPSANILVASKKDFETKNRKKFCSRIATGDYDAVIIGHSQFEKIPISLARQVQMLDDQINELTEAIEEMKYKHGERMTVKQLVKSRKQLEARLKKLNDQTRKDDVVCFEELGVDRIFIDEAHFYKNLFLYTKMRNVAGIAQTEAQKSSDLFMKCRYLDELTGSKGVTFATGTPISNSMVELYTMQRYLQYDALKEQGMALFDAWASTYGETVTAIELAPDGTGYRAKTRFAKFSNIPEMMAMFKLVADIQTSDMLNLPVPKANYHIVKVPSSDIQKDFVQSFADRAERIHAGMVNSSEDNMLLITNDGRKAALDQRLMDPMLPDDPGSKVNACVENVFKTWQETADKRSAQMVFCDLSIPKGDGKFNVYDDIREKLIAKGIPSEEIAFIHTADTDAKKKELFAKVRNGQVRVLMGSTFKMGAGTNCQTRLIALHDLDCPWRPSDLEQRAGRIVRQGNTNPEVDISRYVTEGTFDAYMYQLLEYKQKFISQIMTSKSPVRSAEDVDETALSYAELKAIASGNPKIIEKMQLDAYVAKLKLRKSSHLSQRYQLEDDIRIKFPKRIAETEERIKGLMADKQTVEEHTLQGDKVFTPMTIRDTVYTEKAEAGKAILDICKGMTNPDEKPLGEYRGLSMKIGYNVIGREFFITCKGQLSYHVALGNDAGGIIQRLDNALNGLPERIAHCVNELGELHKQFENAKVEVEKPFPDETELQEKSKRLDALNSELNMDKRENELADGEEKDGGDEQELDQERENDDRDER